MKKKEKNEKSGRLKGNAPPTDNIFAIGRRTEIESRVNFNGFLKGATIEYMEIDIAQSQTEIGLRKESKAASKRTRNGGTVFAFGIAGFTMMFDAVSAQYVAAA